VAATDANDWEDAARRMLDEYGGRGEPKHPGESFKIAIFADGCVAFETCWARRLTRRHAILTNAPALTKSASLFDVVEYRVDPDGEAVFVRRVSQASYGLHVTYADKRHSRAAKVARYGELLSYCYGIQTDDERLPEIEGLVPGVATVSFPLAVPKPIAREMLATCPVVLKVSN
jgi:hypothetical protein